MKRQLIIACFVLLVSAAVHADRFIVNTGPGPEGYPGFSLGGLQWVAVEFTVTTPVTIRRIDAREADAVAEIGLRIFAD